MIENRLLPIVIPQPVPECKIQLRTVYGDPYYIGRMFNNALKFIYDMYHSAFIRQINKKRRPGSNKRQRRVVYIPLRNSKYNLLTNIPKETKSCDTFTGCL